MEELIQGSYTHSQILDILSGEKSTQPIEEEMQ